MSQSRLHCWGFDREPQSPFQKLFETESKKLLDVCQMNDSIKSGHSWAIYTMSLGQVFIVQQERMELEIPGLCSHVYNVIWPFLSPALSAPGQHPHWSTVSSLSPSLSNLTGGNHPFEIIFYICEFNTLGKFLEKASIQTNGSSMK